MGNYHVERAKGLIESGEYNEAITFLRSELDEPPTTLKGAFNLAEIFLRGYRRPEMAIELLKQEKIWLYGRKLYKKHRTPNAAPTRRPRAA